mmetsp:Transcript_58124/g.127403  ORF Transcript_58124/g.127403 Transcript_58124/m.127403 type:complete len:306 (+) Transcript_58124:1135-2052(+)
MLGWSNRIAISASCTSFRPSPALDPDMSITFTAIRSPGATRSEPKSHVSTTAWKTVAKAPAPRAAIHFTLALSELSASPNRSAISGFARPAAFSGGSAGSNSKAVIPAGAMVTIYCWSCTAGAVRLVPGTLGGTRNSLDGLVACGVKSISASGSKSDILSEPSSDISHMVVGCFRTALASGSGGRAMRRANSAISSSVGWWSGRRAACTGLSTATDASGSAAATGASGSAAAADASGPAGPSSSHTPASLLAGTDQPTLPSAPRITGYPPTVRRFVGDPPKRCTMEPTLPLTGKSSARALSSFCC